MEYLLSLNSLIRANITRYTDHLYRTIFGLPQLKHSEITPHLYLGGQYSKNGYKKLKQIGITAVVNMREKQSPRYKDKSPLRVLHLPTIDLHEPNISDIKKGILFIQEEINKGGKVYIHCRLGEGRGPTMMIAYLMNRGFTFEDAYSLVKTVRPFVRLSEIQNNQLKKIEELIHNETLFS